MANLNNEQLRRLARLGAVARLEQIRAEETAIRAEFPELFGGSAGRGGGRGRPRAAQASAAGSENAGRGQTRRRRKMSAAARKEVSERMRKYWADRRKAKAGK